MDYLFQGFLLGMAYVAPIGMQNMFVINTAATKTRLKAYQVALTVVFFDIALAIACFYGVGLLIDKFEVLKYFIMAVGSVAVIYIGISLLKATPSFDDTLDVDKPYLQILTTCFVVTWLNPQAIIDGSLLLGGYRASLPGEFSYLFIFGVCLASTTWFIGLATVVGSAKKAINEQVLKGINIVCGSIIVIYGIKLGYSFIKLII